MKTPVRYGVYAMAMSLGLNVVLVFPLAHAGLALATSLGAFFNAALLYRILRKNAIYIPIQGWWLFISRIFLASALMFVCLHYWVDANDWNNWHATQRIMQLFKWILLGMMIYVVTLVVSGLKLRHVLLSKLDSIGSG